jgi:predicted patatin/cPLA2 family phospholipase
VFKGEIMNRRNSRLAVLAGVLVTLSGCFLTQGHPRELRPPPFQQARFAEDKPEGPPYEPLDPKIIDALRQKLRDVCPIEQAKSEVKPPVNVLAISGGGSHGAFDIGVLHGWSESGQRPNFDVVTGVSTGAFIATFAFLGPRYDETIRDLYLNAKVDDVYEARSWLSILSSDSIASSKPLCRKIEAAISPKILDEVAEAHRQGRRLYVGTTNLDTRRFVIWDLGAIAASSRPDRLTLYRKIVLASGSVPGFFPPVLIDIDIDSKPYQEMHVDGGATTSVFVPMAMTRHHPEKGCRPGSSVYVICSGKLFADGDTVERRFISITFDAISAMLYANARGDIFRIFNMALLCGMDFQLIAIPPDFAMNPDSLEIEPAESKKLYDLGFEMGKTRKGWRTTPPGAELDEQVLPRTGTKFRTAR